MVIASNGSIIWAEEHIKPSIARVGALGRLYIPPNANILYHH
jgi:hypothetical protein